MPQLLVRKHDYLFIFATHLLIVSLFVVVVDEVKLNTFLQMEVTVSCSISRINISVIYLIYYFSAYIFLY